MHTPQSTRGHRTPSPILKEGSKSQTEPPPAPRYRPPDSPPGTPSPHREGDPPPNTDMGPPFHIRVGTPPHTEEAPHSPNITKRGAPVPTQKGGPSSTERGSAESHLVLPRACLRTSSGASDHSCVPLGPREDRWASGGNPLRSTVTPRSLREASLGFPTLPCLPTVHLFYRPRSDDSPTRTGG